MQCQRDSIHIEDDYIIKLLLSDASGIDFTSVLSKKYVHFGLEPHHRASLENIKKKICSVKIISYYDPDPCTPTILQCDVNQNWTGAWIRQINYLTIRIL